MRLDEWQKYIEAQFLDEVEPVDFSAKPQPGSALEAPIAPTSGSHGTAQAHSAEHATLLSAADSIASLDITSETARCAPEIARGIGVELSNLPTDRSARQPVAGDTGRRTFAPGFPADTDVEVDIPEFNTYLPSSHRAARLEPPQFPPRRSQTGRQTELGPDLKTQITPLPIAAGDGSTDCVSATSTCVDAAPDQNTSEIDVLPNVRRAARSRARHARNVRPDSVPSGLSAGELWATVPKHVQTLLALERLEEEQEVAQFSYKRPFQEKRHELIERLLDPILSLEDTARLLNVCPTTVRRYTNKGILTYYRKEPDRATRNSADAPVEDERLSENHGKETRQRRFRLSDILAFLETQQAALEADRNAEESGAVSSRKRRTSMDSDKPDIP